MVWRPSHPMSPTAQDSKSFPVDEATFIPANRWPRRAIRWLSGAQPSDAGVFYLAYFLLLPFFLAPLFVTRLLPGLDLPFHMAMADYLSKVGAPNSPYVGYYDGGLRIAPYAAHFIALLGLGKIMPMFYAHKVIMVAYVGGLPLSMGSLLSTCKRSRSPALLAFPLAYNLSLHYGFVSFAFSLPILLLLLRQMVMTGRAATRNQLYFAWGSTAFLAFLLFLCHLQNYLYGFCAALAFAMLTPVSVWRRLFTALALIPSFAGLAYWHLTSPPIVGHPPLTLSMIWGFIVAHRKRDLGAKTIPTDFLERLQALPIQAMRAFADRAEVQACGGLILILLAYFLMGFFTWTGKGMPLPSRSEKKQRMRLAAVVAFVGALAAYLILPHHLDELELMTFYPRFAVLVVLMGILLIPAGLVRFRGIIRLAVPLPAVILCMLYGKELTLHYKRYAVEVADFLAVMEKAPPGKRAIGLVYNRASGVMNIESALLGLPGFYPALKPAPGSMTIPQYCGMRHMPCQKTGAASFTDLWVPWSFAPKTMLPVFDLMFVRSRPPASNLFVGYSRSIELLAKVGTWELYQRKPGPLVPDPPPPPPPAPPVPPPPPAR